MSPCHCAVSEASWPPRVTSWGCSRTRRGRMKGGVLQWSLPSWTRRRLPQEGPCEFTSTLPSRCQALGWSEYGAFAQNQVTQSDLGLTPVMMD